MSKPEPAPDPADMLRELDKVLPDAPGEIKLAFGVSGGLVRISFGKPVSWLGLTKAQSEMFAATILELSRQLP